MDLNLLRVRNSVNEQNTHTHTYTHTHTHTHTQNTHTHSKIILERVKEDKNK